METNTDILGDFYAGHFLIATPAMGDPQFARAVIYLCSHSADEAMGLIINEGLDGLSLSDLLTGMDMSTVPKQIDGPILAGGPVEPERGFVLHPSEYYNSPTSFSTSKTLALTTSKDILTHLTGSNPPAKARMALGYSGWSSGQLEREISQNAWLVAPANDAIIFETPLNDIWTKALASLGIRPEMLSGLSGTA